MPERSDIPADASGQHSHRNKGPALTQAHDYEQEPPEHDDSWDSALGSSMSAGAGDSGSEGGGDGTFLQRKHARLLGDTRLNRSLNVQRRNRLMLQLQRTYGNSHLQQVNRIIQREHQPGAKGTHEGTAEATSGDASEAESGSVTNWEIRPKGTTTGVPIQRFPIRGGSYNETLLEDAPTPTPAPGTTTTPGTGATPATPPPTPAYVANSYTGSTAFDMTRQSDGVHVNVRILFLSPPTDRDASGTILPDTDPRRRGSEIPAGDPRRAQAATLTASGGGVTSYWNNKFELVGRRNPAAPPGAGAGSRSDAGPPAGTTPGSSSSTPATGSGEEVVLRLIFEATPVWSQSQEHDQRVFLHGDSDPADPSRADPSRNLTPATPPPPGTAAPTPRMSVIDAGNWYTARAPRNYGAGSSETDPRSFPLDAIYAHEYGHYLGIPDEYSQSNPSMHTILHGITPNQADRDRMDQELNTATTIEIILAAMLPQLQTHFNSVSGQVLQSIQAQKRAIERRLATALREGWRSPATIDGVTREVESHLAAQPAVAASGATPATAAQPEQTRALRASRQAVVFEATRNLSYSTIAENAVSTALSAGATDGWINGLISDALNGAMGSVTNNHVHKIGAGVAQLGAQGLDMRVDTQGVAGTSATLDTQAGNAARTIVGAAPAGTTPPAVHPSGSLLAQISGLPAQWQTMANMFNSSEVADLINTQAAANLTGGDFRGGVNDNVRRLYRQLYDRFNAIARRVSYDALGGFITGQIQPLVEGQLRDIITAIRTEAAGHTTATPTGTNAGTATPDPALQARAQAIQSAIRAAVPEAQTIQNTPETTTTPSTTPGAAPTVTQNRLHVRVTAHSAMGSQYESQSVRPNYMDSIARNFNVIRDPAVFRHEDETEFTVRRTGGGGGGGGGAGP